MVTVMALIVLFVMFFGALVLFFCPFVFLLCFLVCFFGMFVVIRSHISASMAAMVSPAISIEIGRAHV